MISQDVIPTSWIDPAARHMLEWKIHWLFRLAVCGEFIGHGAFGVMTKQGWVPYFTLFGFPAPWAWQLMPMVGSVDNHPGDPRAHRPDTRWPALYGLLGVLHRPAPAAGGGRWMGVTRTRL